MGRAVQRTLHGSRQTPQARRGADQLLRRRGRAGGNEKRSLKDFFLEKNNAKENQRLTFLSNRDVLQCMF